MRKTEPTKPINIQIAEEILNVQLLILSKKFGVTRERLFSRNRSQKLFFCRVIVCIEISKLDIRKSDIARLTGIKRDNVGYYIRSFESCYKYHDHFRKMYHDYKYFFNETPRK